MLTSVSQRDVVSFSFKGEFMKKILLTLTALTLIPTMAQAETAVQNASAASELNGIYLSAKASYSHFHITRPKVYVNGVYQQTVNSRSDNEFGGGIAVGYDHTKCGFPVRTEIEFMMHNDMKTTGARIGTDTLTANVYYDFKNESKFTPFINGGVGIAFNRFRISNPAFTKTDQREQFTWNVGAGVAYSITKNVVVDLAYRFADYGVLRFKKEIGPGAVLKVQGDNTAQEVLLGLRYHF